MPQDEEPNKTEDKEQNITEEKAVNDVKLEKKDEIETLKNKVNSIYYDYV